MRNPLMEYTSRPIQVGSYFDNWFFFFFEWHMWRKWSLTGRHRLCPVSELDWQYYTFSTTSGKSFTCCFSVQIRACRMWHREELAALTGIFGRTAKTRQKNWNRTDSVALTETLAQWGCTQRDTEGAFKWTEPPRQTDRPTDKQIDR